MNLLHVTHQYRPAIGGAEEYIASLSEALAHRDHRITVFTANSTDYESWTGQLPATERINGVDVHRFKAIPRRRLTWEMLRRSWSRYLSHPHFYLEPFILVGNGPSCPGMFARIATEGRRYDALHLNSLHYAHTAYAYTAARMAGRPVIVTPHVHVEQRVTWDVGYMRFILNHADLIFADTDYERRFHLARGRDPDSVVSAGVGLRLEEYPFESQAMSRRRLDIADEAQVVLFLGRQVDYKGLDKVLAAGARLQSTYPRLLVLVVGPESEWGQTLMTRYQGTGWLRNLGQVAPQTKLDALSAADMMVMPSHGEAFGITYLESWLASRPVIGLAKGAVQDLIEDGNDGLLVPPDDDPALGAAIQRLLDDPSFSCRLGQAGRQKVLNRYTISKVTDIVESACERLVGPKGK